MTGNQETGVYIYNLISNAPRRYKVGAVATFGGLMAAVIFVPTPFVAELQPGADINCSAALDGDMMMGSATMTVHKAKIGGTPDPNEYVNDAEEYVTEGCLHADYEYSRDTAGKVACVVGSAVFEESTENNVITYQCIFNSAEIVPEQAQN